MRNVIALIAAFALVAGFTGEGRQLSTPRGLVIEAVERGSAADQAGLKPGDELISWSRSIPPSTAPVAQGEFRTPFDARDFELEQLSRRGAAVVVMRGSKRIDASLIPGFWEVTVRPAMSEADLGAYEAGRALEKERPSDALAKWQPLIDRYVAAGETGNAAWLMTRAASAFVAIDQTGRADELFERAAALLRAPANPLPAAMVWEAKGRAYFPEYPFGRSEFLKRLDQHCAAAMAAHEQALALRSSLGPQNLAAASSKIGLGNAAMRCALSMPGGSTETHERAFQEAGARLKEALTTLADLAPGSFAHAHALFWRSTFVSADFAGLSPYTLAQARAATELLRREAWPIFDAVAPTHELFLAVISTGPGGEEALLRREFTLAAQLGERITLFEAALKLCNMLSDRGATDEAISIIENLKRSGMMDYVFVGTPREFDLAKTYVLKGTRMPLLTNLAVYYTQRGDFSAAEQTLLSLLDYPEILPSQQIRWLEQLGSIAIKHGDLASAETMYRRALDLNEQVASAKHAASIKLWATRPTELPPDLSANRARATTLDWHRRDEIEDYSQLAEIAEARGNIGQARDFLQRAAVLDATDTTPWSPLDPKGVRSARVPARFRLARLGRVARLNGDLAAAEAFASQALATVQQALRGSVYEADALQDIGTIRHARRDFDRAASSLRDALALRQQLQPRSPALATTLHWLGVVARDSGNRVAALGYFESALDVLDDQRERIVGGRLSTSALDATLMNCYADTVELLLADGQLARAFQVVERSRGRAQLQMLSARDLRDGASVPPALRDERQRLEAEYDQTQTRIETLTPSKDGAAIGAELAHLQELRLRLEGVDRSVAAIDPRTAALKHPVALTLAQARAGLDLGTALLSYLVGADHTYLFVVTPPSANAAAGDPGLLVYTLPVGEKDLRASVNAFRNVIELDTNPATANRAALLKRGRDLYDLLIRPAESRIGSAERLLLSLDGPMHALPFAALVRGSATRPQYLAEWKPLHMTTSGSVYAETLRSRRPADRTGPVVAFGDPVYAQNSAAPADAEVAFLTRRGVTLAPLPATRREVGAIANLYGRRATTYLGGAATEAQAKSINQSSRLIHFAVHGVLNEQLPLNSALVLTQPTAPGPGEDNGLLQAWEIIEKMRIDADLVTLSACESGLGKEIAGEGLVGLTRAFQYAGARTVAASLWKVADGPTAELMKQFYTNLRNGQTKDQALRNAQIALIRMGRQPNSQIDFASPAHWAAFTLTGDWK